MKKLLCLLLTAALLGCVALSGAEAAYDFHLPTVEKRFTPRVIENEEDAIAYAREVWSSDFCQQDVEGFEFTAYPGEGEWEVYGTKGEDDLWLVLTFDASGALTSLDNGYALSEMALPEDDDGMTGVLEDVTVDPAFADFLLDFCRCAAPAFEEEAFEVLAFEYDDPAFPEFDMEMGLEYSFSVLVQLAPSTRIVELARSWG